MSELKFFRVVNSKNPCSVIRGLVIWFPEHYTVKMLDESTAYEGEVIIDVMSKYCQIFKISVEKYFEECKTAFKTTESSLYTFSIEGEQFNVRKIAQSGSNLKVTLTSVRLKKVDYSSVAIELLDGALKCNGNYSQTIDSLSSKAGSLRTDNQKMVALLEEMEKEKRQFESIIYHKFVNLLNSKKQFHDKQGNIALKTESRDQVPRAENVESIFEADTDSDEASDTSSPNKDQPGPSVCSVSPKKSPGSPNITSYSSPQKSTSVESVLSSFAFLDPTVSFSNK